jgi:hypothetical protein
VTVVERGQPLSFEDVPGFVGLLDEHHEPILERQPCRYSWSPGPGTWTVAILTGHAFDLSALNGSAEAWYVAIYGGRAADELMFTFPFVGRPVITGQLGVGPDLLIPRL